MPKVFISQPLSYDFRVYEGPRFSLRQNGFHKIVTKEQQKSTSLKREHYMPCKQRNHKAERFSQKQKRRLERSVCSKNIRAINLPPDWDYPEYKNLEKSIIEQSLKMEGVHLSPKKQKEFFFTENSSQIKISNELNKNETNFFPVEKWEKWAINKNSFDGSQLSKKEWDHTKAFLYVILTSKPVQSVLNEFGLQIPEYKIPTEEEMSQTELNEIEALAKRKEVFGSFLKNRDGKIEGISNEILREKALNLDCRDIQEQSLQGSTKAIPGLIEDAYEALSNSEGIEPEEAQNHLTFIGVVMSPNPLVKVTNDADRIYQFLREHGTEAYFWLQKGFHQDMQGNIEVDGKRDYPRSKKRLKFVWNVSRMILSEIQPKIENGTLHCRYPDWKKEVYSGIYGSALHEIELMKEDRSEIEKLNTVQAPQQTFSNIFEPD